MEGRVARRTGTWVARLAVVAMSVTAIVGAVGVAAQADPANNPNVMRIDVTCGGSDYSIYANFNGKWAVGHVETSNGIEIPRAITATDVTVGEELFSVAKPAQPNKTYTTCTNFFVSEHTRPGDTIEVDVTARFAA